MTRSVFGWDLPPGCSMRDIDRQAGIYDVCQVCGEPENKCICPECTMCGDIGNPHCYEKHGLRLSKEQVLLADWNDALIEEENRQEIKYYESLPGRSLSECDADCYGPEEN